MIDSIRTGRLELRPLVVDDAEDLAELLDDPVVREWLAPEGLAALRERFRRWERRRSPDGSQAWLNWVTRRLDDGAAVGWVQATVTGSSAEIAYATLASQRRRGYGAEAVRALVGWLDVASVEAHIALANEASVEAHIALANVASVEAHIALANEASAAVARAAGLRPTDELHDGEVVWRLAPHHPAVSSL